MNVFSLLWNLSSKRAELAGRIKPVLLAQVVVIQHGFPDLHKLLQQNPHFLIELETFFRHEKKQKLQGGSRFEFSTDIRERLDNILLHCGPFNSYNQLQVIFEEIKYGARHYILFD